MSAEGYTVLIVEQNVRQVLKVADRAYLLEIGRIKTSGSAAELLASDDVAGLYGDLSKQGDQHSVIPGLAKREPGTTHRTRSWVPGSLLCGAPE